MQRWTKRKLILAVVGALVLLGVGLGTVLAASTTYFSIARSKGVVSAGCLPYAYAVGSITPLGPVERMVVYVQGLPPNTDFDVFVIQVPNAPFGISWYQGDLLTDATGKGSQYFFGRFNIETFAVAPGSAVP